MIRNLLITVLFFSSAALAAEPQSGQPVNYKISPEDLLNISVWKEPELQREVIVRPDGGVSFPLVGDIQAAGKTPNQLQNEIAEAIQDYVPGAVVTVSVLEIRGLRIYVSGNVENPGQYTVGRYVDVVQAITLAGGLTPFANADDIRIIRREGGSEKIFKFDYREVQRGRNLEQNIMLQPDDVVMVP